MTVTERADPGSPARRWATLMSATLLMVGLLTMLRSGAGEWDVVHARTFIRWPGHFLTGVAELAVGLTGVWCATRESLTRGHLTVAGLFLTVWALAAVVLRGDPNDVFSANRWLVGIHLVCGVVSLGFAAWSAHRGLTDAPAP